MQTKFSEVLSQRSIRAFLMASLAVVLNTVPLSASAEYLGLISGREATPDKTSQLSAELSIVTGELDSLDYQNIGLRLNYRYTPQTVIIGTIGVGEFSESDGTPFGLGVLYHLSNQRISDAVEIAAKASYHWGNYSLDDVDANIGALSLEVLVSGVKPLMRNGMAWYSSIGFQNVSVDFDDTDSINELGLGAGVVLPTGLGNAYLGFEYFDSLTIGLGIRYFVY